MYVPVPRPIRVRRNYLFEDALERLSALGEGIKDRLRVQFVDLHGMEEAGIEGLSVRRAQRATPTRDRKNGIGPAQGARRGPKTCEFRRLGNLLQGIRL